MVTHACGTSTQGLRQEDCELKDSLLSYIVRLCLKKKKKRGRIGGQSTSRLRFPPTPLPYIPLTDPKPHCRHHNTTDLECPKNITGHPGREGSMGKEKSVCSEMRRTAPPPSLPPSLQFPLIPWKPLHHRILLRGADVCEGPKSASALSSLRDACTWAQGRKQALPSIL